jgi:hypothetical protein
LFKILYCLAGLSDQTLQSFRLHFFIFASVLLSLYLPKSLPLSRLERQAGRQQMHGVGRLVIAVAPSLCQRTLCRQEM